MLESFEERGAKARLLNLFHDCSFDSGQASFDFTTCVRPLGQLSSFEVAECESKERGVRGQKAEKKPSCQVVYTTRTDALIRSRQSGAVRVSSWWYY